jgi:hypothetical protein
MTSPSLAPAVLHFSPVVVHPVKPVVPVAVLLPVNSPVSLPLEHVILFPALVSNVVAPYALLLCY